ncbi:MAG: EamA family transporter [Candidatus Parvarchaeota archaeon]|nr:EamA family transporter [Candidatus Jingweiarchaeum tengchongense]MCW1298559.1 EamA family transporter [Candidatus Jingweiarchaeum tengchongense]MCW1304582.1 EamA family transporter [Candidatus Jingweiarchaeum tengchongense]MCW1309871.1 EamA family transporter [Candidatus Jingweiarchaeum tengchongense]MCW1310254.1 EamA family transporter [Candidatus Jingweiarchaeum tengchongense]
MLEIWFIFALLAPASFASCNIIDKFVLSKAIKNPYIYVIFFTFIEICFALLILLFFNVDLVHPYSIIGILCGVAAFFSYLLYSKAMSIEEASKVTPLIHITPLFVIFFAVLFLNEILIFEKYLGISLVMIGIFLISSEKVGKKWGFSPALKFMLLFAMIYGFVDIVEKFLLKYISYLSLIFLISFGSFLSALSMLFIKNFRNEFLGTISKIKVKIFLIVVISEIFYYVGITSFLIATKIAPVSLTSTITSIQPLFVLFYTTILSVLAPNVIKEKVNVSILSKKVVSIVLILIGIWFIGT